MSFKYNRYIARVTRHPWAITPEKFAIIADLMRFRASGEKLSDEVIAERFGATQAAAGGAAPRSDGAVAVIPVHGTIAHRADSFEASSGGASCESIGRMVQRALGDESIKSIMLDFDTPGGSVEGVPELAAIIAKGTAVKPIVAHVNALAASAGYYLASQCTEIVCTPSGQVGSIGVFMLMVDQSEYLAKEGIKVNAISAGDYKLEGASWEPMSEETREFYQGQVDACYRDFIAAVAKGREVSVSDVKQKFGQGRCYDAKLALSLGMIDRIATADETLARMVTARVTVGAKRAASAVDVPIASSDGAPADVSTHVLAGGDIGIQDQPEPAEAMPESVTPDADAVAAEHEAILAVIG